MTESPTVPSLILGEGNSAVNKVHKSAEKKADI
jgi:hypothetical protein